VALLETFKQKEQFLQEESASYQEAAKQGLTAARAKNKSIKRARAEVNALRPRAEKLLEGTDKAPVRFVSRRSNKSIHNEYGSYKPVEIERTEEGYVKRYNATFQSSSRQKAVYARKTEYYDAEGHLLRVEEQTTAGSGSHEHIRPASVRVYDKEGKVVREERRSYNREGSVTEKVVRTPTSVQTRRYAREDPYKKPMMAAAGLTAMEYESLKRYPDAYNRMKQHLLKGTLRKTGGGGVTTTTRVVKDDVAYRRAVNEYANKLNAQGITAKDFFPGERREFYYDFGTGKKIPTPQQSAPRGFTASDVGLPLTSTTIQYVSGQRTASVQRRVVSRKAPTTFKSGYEKEAFTVKPASASEAMLLTGHPQASEVVFERERVLPSKASTFVTKTTKKLDDKARGTFYHGVAVAVKEGGKRLQSWGEARASKLPSRKATAVHKIPLFGTVTTTKELNMKRGFFEDVAGAGVFLKSAGDTMLKHPTRVVVTGAAVAGFTLLTGGLGAAGYTATAGTLQGLGVAATTAYGYNVLQRTYAASNKPYGISSTLGSEAPYFASAVAGGTVAGAGVETLKAWKMASTAKKVVGLPATQVWKELPTVVREPGIQMPAVTRQPEMRFVTDKLLGVRYARSTIGDRFGFRGVETYEPVFANKPREVSVTELPKNPQYVRATLKGYEKIGIFAEGKYYTVEGKVKVDRVLPGEMAAKLYKEPRVNTIKHPWEEAFGYRQARSGFIKFSEAKGGLVKGTGTRTAPYTEYFKDFWDFKKNLDLMRSVKVWEVKPARVRFSSVEPAPRVAGEPSVTRTTTIKPSSEQSRTSVGGMELLQHLRGKSVKPTATGEPDIGLEVVTGVKFNKPVRETPFSKAFAPGEGGATMPLITPFIKSAAKRPVFKAVPPKPTSAFASSRMKGFSQQPATRTSSAARPLSDFDFKPSTKIEPIIDTGTIPIIDTQSDSWEEQVTPPPTEPPRDLFDFTPPPPKPPEELLPRGFGFPPLALPPWGSGGKSRSPKGRKYRYEPSLLGLLAGVKRRGKSKLTFGLGVRGL